MKILGVLIIVLGIALGVYLGIYLLLFGGICQIINGISPLNAKEIAIGIVRVLFSEIGMIPVYIFGVIGGALIAND